MPWLQPWYSRKDGPLRLRADRGNRFAAPLALRVLGQTHTEICLENILKHFELRAKHARHIKAHRANNIY